MKKIIALLFATVIALNMSGQSFGLKGGIALTSFIGADAVDQDSRTGFYFGTFMMLGEGNIEWMPEVIFHQKGTKQVREGLNSEVIMNYLDIGLNGLFHINDELSLAIGPCMGYAASGEIKQSINGNTDSKSINDWNAINRIEFGTNLGAIYNVNDLLHLDLRYGIGFTDIFEQESLRNSTFQIGIGYIFGY